MPHKLPYRLQIFIAQWPLGRCSDGLAFALPQNWDHDAYDAFAMHFHFQCSMLQQSSAKRCCPQTGDKDSAQNQISLEVLDDTTVKMISNDIKQL